MPDESYGTEPGDPGRALRIGGVGEQLTPEAVTAFVTRALAGADLDGRRVCLVVPDGTRTCPLPLILRACHAALAGRAAEVTVLIALGTHQPMTEEQLGRHLGYPPGDVDSVYPGWTVRNHESWRPEIFVHLGTIGAQRLEALTGGRLPDAGVEVRINRLVADADVALVVGPVFPHEVVGFSGGNKYFFPGVSGQELIDLSHWVGALITSAEMIGTRGVTPVRALINEAAAMVPAERLALCLVVASGPAESGGGTLHAAAFGTPEDAWAACAAVSAEVHVSYLDRAYPRVLSVMPTKYEDIWTAAKGFYKLEPIVADGGELIIYAPHITEVSVMHPQILAIGYHNRDYFLGQWERFAGQPWGDLAHSTHLRGQGTWDAERGERNRVTVTLATGIGEDVVRAVNLSYRDPATVDLSAYEADPDTFVVPHAGEVLYRLRPGEDGGVSAATSAPSGRPPRLSRATAGLPAAAPVRIVHLGLGNFHRAHQVWYTANAPDATDWGIAAFTGRRPDAAEQLAPQDGLHTLITRSAEGDSFSVLGNLVAVHAATDHSAYLDHLRRPEVAVVTITVTEAGYLRRPDGHLDADRETVADDIAALRADPAAPVVTLPGKLVAGMLARRAADAGPITILSCDNLPDNGQVTATVVTELAAAVDASLPAWIAGQVDFATSVVDRITPATTEDDRRLVAETQGYHDAAPVPTEPYAEWVIAGRFPAGRPRWEDAGARLVHDVGPYEQRKLWLLNGSHSLLAYAGSIRGHATIDEAIADPGCRDWVETFWDEASRHLVLPADAVTDYRAALLDRFGNPRVRHQLAQIAPDESIKLPVRIIPPLRAERAEGRMPVGCATVLAAWVLHLQGQGAPFQDPGADAARTAAAAPDPAAAVSGVLDTLAERLSADRALVEAVVTQLDAITR